MKKIVHIITGLNNGGAEMMLYKLLKSIDRQRYDMSVISMLDKGIMGEKIEELGIPVSCLNMNKTTGLLTSIQRAIRLCKEADIIQTWMYHANLFGLIINLLLKKKMIWGIRRGALDPHIDKKRTRLIAKICAVFSRKADVIVYCAKNSRIFHEQVLKYNKEHALVIPNGFELGKYKRDKSAGADFRNKMEINSGTTVITFIGRYHAVKGYVNFCKALRLISNELNENYRVLFIGTGSTNDNQELKKLITENRLEYNSICLGRRDDIPTILSASDMYVSASYTEAFSNVIGEAMACEVPCVVTDVGDSAYIIGEAGITVKNNRPAVLAEGIREMYNKSMKERIELGYKARLRVKELFDIEVVTKEYEKLYK